MPISIPTSGHANGLSNGANGVTSQNGHANGYTNGHTNGHFNGNLNGANGTATSNGRANGHAVSVSNGSHDMNGRNGYTNGHTNGYTNGHANGYTNDHANGHTNGTNGVDLKDIYSNIHPHDLPNANKEVPVAICGMATRLPGGIRSDRDLYKFLFNKRDARSVVGADRYNVDGYYSPHGQSGTISTKQGYFLSDLDYANMDLSMFTFTTAEAEQVDPHHRLVLEVVREAFESAGESEWRRQNIGTYVGMFTEDWQEMDHKDNLEFNSHRIMGGTDFALPNRIAYEYDLKGPRQVQ